MRRGAFLAPCPSRCAFPADEKHRDAAKWSWPCHAESRCELRPVSSCYPAWGHQDPCAYALSIAYRAWRKEGALLMRFRKIEARELAVMLPGSGVISPSGVNLSDVISQRNSSSARGYTSAEAVQFTLNTLKPGTATPDIPGVLRACADAQIGPSVVQRI